MTLLAAGLAQFVVSHLLPAVPRLRESFITRLGPVTYRIAFSLVSTAALLLGTLIWSALHLLANGDFRGAALFGTFLVYSVVDLASVGARGPIASFAPRARADLIAVVAGVAVSLLVMAFHRVLFGPRVVPFGG